MIEGRDKRVGNINKKILGSIIFFFVIFFLAVNVSSLGVTPARNTVDFKPNLQKGYSFSIVNSESKDMGLTVSTRGDLADFIVLNERNVQLGSSEDMRKVSYTLNLPEEMSPGTHIGEIVIAEPSKQVKEGETFVGATLAVVTQVYVYVPYPGKYAEAKLNIVNAEVGGEATFIIPIASLGDFDLNEVYANVDVYSSLNEKIDSFNTETYGIKSGEKVDMIYKWKADVPVGNYKAKVTVIYDGKTINLEDDFKVGSAYLELQDLYANDFSLGEIVKVDMLVENKWSEPISGAHSIMEVYSEQGDLLDRIKSPDYDIPALGKEILSSYWDTNGVPIGTYDTKVILGYGDTTIDNDLELEVSEDELTVIGLGYVISSDARGTKKSSNSLNSTVTILIVVVVILVLLNLLWFLILRKNIIKK